MPPKNRPLPRLARGEIELLEMLWRTGPVSLIEAHRALDRQIGYTTVQTRLNRLVVKKLARRSDDRPARYEAAVSAADVRASDLNLLRRVSGDNIVPLVAHLVRDRTLSANELAELKQLIDEAERKLLHSSKRKPRR